MEVLPRFASNNRRAVPEREGETNEMKMGQERTPYPSTSPQVLLSEKTDPTHLVHYCYLSLFQNTDHAPLSFGGTLEGVGAAQPRSTRRTYILGPTPVAQ